MAGFWVGFTFQVHMSGGFGVVMDTRFVCLPHFCHTYFVSYSGRLKSLSLYHQTADRLVLIELLFMVGYHC